MYLENVEEIIFKKRGGKVMNGGIFGLFGFVYIIIILGLGGLGIYVSIMFIKLANRGIKALDIYIDEKTNNKI